MPSIPSAARWTKPWTGRRTDILISGVSSKDLKAALKEHLAETKAQIKMLDRVFTSIGEKASGEKCEAIEHYEIARYGTPREWAKALGHDEAHELLSKILDQEKKANHSLTHLAVTSINQA